MCRPRLWGPKPQHHVKQQAHGCCSPPYLGPLHHHHPHAAHHEQLAAPYPVSCGHPSGCPHPEPLCQHPQYTECSQQPHPGSEHSEFPHTAAGHPIFSSLSVLSASDEHRESATDFLLFLSAVTDFCVCCQSAGSSAGVPHGSHSSPQWQQCHLFEYQHHPSERQRDPSEHREHHFPAVCPVPVHGTTANHLRIAAAEPQFSPQSGAAWYNQCGRLPRWPVLVDVQPVSRTAIGDHGWPAVSPAGGADGALDRSSGCSAADNGDAQPSVPVLPGHCSGHRGACGD